MLIYRYDYREKPDGKSYCDDKIAQMTGNMSATFVAVHVQKTSKKALDKGEDMPGCHIVHVKIHQPADQIMLQRKKSITKFSNVQFENYGHINY